MDDYLEICDRCGEYFPDGELIVVECFMMICEECYDNIEQENDDA